MANYGDVALNLSPDWDRNKLYNKDFAQQTVGHSGGKADAFLTKSPDEAHQFYWVPKLDQRMIASRQVDGYRFVTKDEWSINKELGWEFDAEGIASFGFERLMARPAAKYHETERAKAELRKSKAQREREAELQAQAASGVRVEEGYSANVVSRRR